MDRKNTKLLASFQVRRPTNYLGSFGTPIVRRGGTHCETTSVLLIVELLTWLCRQRLSGFCSVAVDGCLT
jgi:hypothetical protein